MAKQHAPGFLKLVTDAKSRVKECSVDDVKARLAAADKFVLVDVREDNEYTACHAAGAIHLGKGVIERDIEKTVPDANTPIVLYCGGGFRSALAADAIQKMGAYTNVIQHRRRLGHGSSAGLPTEK